MAGVLVQIETPTKRTFKKNSVLLGIMEISQNDHKLYNELNELQKILRKIVFGRLHGKKNKNIGCTEKELEKIQLASRLAKTNLKTLAEA